MVEETPGEAYCMLGMQYLQACAEEGDEESIAALAALNAEEQGA